MRLLICVRIEDEAYNEGHGLDVAPHSVTPIWFDTEEHLLSPEGVIQGPSEIGNWLQKMATDLQYFESFHCLYKFVLDDVESPRVHSDIAQVVKSADNEMLHALWVRFFRGEVSLANVLASRPQCVTTNTHERRSCPTGLSGQILIDSAGEVVVADIARQRILRVLPSGELHLLFQSSAQPESSQPLHSFSKVGGDAWGRLYLLDEANQQVFRLNEDRSCDLVVDGTAPDSLVSSPADLLLGPDGLMVVVDVRPVHWIDEDEVERESTERSLFTLLPNGRLEPIPTKRIHTFAGRVGTSGLLVSSGGALHILPDWMDGEGYQLAELRDSVSFAVTDAAVDSAGEWYALDAYSHRVMKGRSFKNMTQLAGHNIGHRDGLGLLAQFDCPSAIAIDASDLIYVLDGHGQRLRRLGSDGMVTTMAQW